MSEATTIPTDAPEAPADLNQSTETVENGKSNFTERIRTDPDFAVGTTKELQRQVSLLQNRLKPLEALETVSKGTFGNVADGVTQIIGLADRQYRIEQNPDWKRAQEDILAGKRVSPTQVAEPDAAEEYVTPEERQIKALQTKLETLETNVTRHDTRMAQTELTSRLSNFFQSDIGRALEGEEREGMVQALQTQFRTWSNSPQGREVINNLQSETIDQVAIGWLHKQGKLANVYDRIRAGKDKQRLGASTDSPSGVPTGSTTESREFKTAAEALRFAAKEFLPPESRQRLGW